jgi:hypothetical protein
VSLGIAGVQAAGGPPGIAQVVDPWSDWMPAACERLVFCEGFARDADGRHYAWEITTDKEYERVVYRDLPDLCSSRPPTIATLRLGAGDAAPEVDVLELIDDSGWAWTQVLVSAATFGRPELDALFNASPEDRAIFFSLVADE